MRSLAQSLAREFGPQGIHVAHAIIDGVIDIERTKGWKVSDLPDAKISPHAVSLIYTSSIMLRHDEVGCGANIDHRLRTLIGFCTRNIGLA
jgi:hypothetical protein